MIGPIVLALLRSTPMLDVPVNNLKQSLQRRALQNISRHTHLLHMAGTLLGGSPKDIKKHKSFGVL